MTEITNSNHQPKKAALLLGGGGARAAYQVGVLKAIAEIVPKGCANPFPIICGTSAGSINTIAMASYASNFHLGVKRTLAVWSRFNLGHVFYADSKNLLKRIAGWMWSQVGFGDHHQGPSSRLDNSPLRALLKRYISFDRIDRAIESGDLHAYCLTACSYTSGESTTFFNGHASIEEWSRTHRGGTREKMNIEHLMASSAIPVIFPSVRLGAEYFGDGSMRQISPISPAIHLGAEKILVIGLRKESELGLREPPKYRPSLAQMSGYVMDTLFLNSLYSDLERMERINRTLKEKNQEAGDNLKIIEHLVISPSQDIANIALKHFKKLPKGFQIALGFLGMKKGNSRRFISYLMFIEAFCNELIELGYRDAMAQQDSLKEFLKL